MTEKTPQNGNNRRKLTQQIAVKSIFAIVMLLVVFSALMCFVGYRSFTDALMRQYAEDAFHIADTAALFIEPGRIEEYVADTFSLKNAENASVDADVTEDMSENGVQTEKTAESGAQTEMLAGSGAQTEKLADRGAEAEKTADSSVEPENAANTANTQPDAPRQSSASYEEVWHRLSDICNSSGATFVYVIVPDRSDYGHITFIFSTINENNSYKVYERGYVRETTNDEYRQKYRALYETSTQHELVVRDKGYIETDHHITAMVPLRGTDGETKAILCVQRQMETLAPVRHGYINKVIQILLVLTLIVIFGQSIYLNRKLLLPVKTITNEASRFAMENVTTGRKLADQIHNKDEIGQLANAIDHMEEQVQAYVEDLTRVTAEKEHIITELSLATRIQADMLPNIFPAFPERHDFDIYATMNPAKAVGGDFYDFFLVDEDHLCLVIADVSGKGVPAALFMMASKIILNNLAIMGLSPAQVLERTNQAICSNNREEMFVTVWIGILELSTGKIKAANAGHEKPLILHMLDEETEPAGQSVAESRSADAGQPAAENQSTKTESLAADSRSADAGEPAADSRSTKTESFAADSRSADFEQPALRAQFEVLNDRHGFVVGGMEGMKYRDYEIQLKKGSRLFLYTDGVPEAIDRHSRMFGISRMLDTLNRDITRSPQQLIDGMTEAVNSFVGETEQFDDMTMLCLQWNGREKEERTQMEVTC